MGFFDLFGSKEKRDESALKKQAQRLVQKYGPAENRQKVIEQLAAQGTPDALAVLCLRFTVRTEPTITDAEEKEEVRRQLVAAGPKAVAPVKEFVERQEEGISWGLRVLAELLPSHEVLATAPKADQTLAHQRAAGTLLEDLHANFRGRLQPLDLGRGPGVRRVGDGAGHRRILGAAPGVSPETNPRAREATRPSSTRRPSRARRPGPSRTT